MSSCTICEVDVDDVLGHLLSDHPLTGVLVNKADKTIAIATPETAAAVSAPDPEPTEEES